MGMLIGSFTVTREIKAPLPRVWDAYSVEKSRSAWRRIPGPESVLTLDFRVGGWERLTGNSAATGTVEAIASHALFLDIVERERIVACHEALSTGCDGGVPNLDRVRADRGRHQDHPHRAVQLPRLGR